MGTVVCEHLRKEFSGGVVAVDDFHVDFGENEFVVIVGPSAAESQYCHGFSELRPVSAYECI